MRAFSLLKRYGVKGFVIKAEEKLNNKIAKDYSAEYESLKPTEEELNSQRDIKFNYNPLISIVVPTYNTNEAMLRKLLDSVVSQTYGMWQLCIADASSQLQVKDIVEQYIISDRVVGSEDRICYKKLANNGGISDNTNAGFKMVKGDYVALLDHDDELSPNALFEVVKAINDLVTVKNIKPIMLYSDEDKVNEDSTYHFAPHFKQDFNRELLNRYNYVCHLLVFSKEVLTVVGGLNKGYDGSQDHDFILRITEKYDEEHFIHIPKVLYHWRVHNGSTAGASENKNYAYTAGLKAVADHFTRVGMKDVTSCQVKGHEYYGVARNHSIKDEDVYAFVNDKIDASADWKNVLSQYLGDTDWPIGMVGGKLIRGGKVVSCGYKIESDGLVPMCEGIKSYWKGYSWLAAVPRDVDMISMDFFVADVNALKKSDIIDENGKLIVTDPLVVANRMHAAGYRIIVDGTVVGKYRD